MKSWWSLTLLVMAVSVTLVSAGTFSVDFPLSSDTWELSDYPNWCNQGDTVYGDRDLGTSELTEVTIYLPISDNNLSYSGYVDLDLRLDSTTIASFTITAADGSGMLIRNFAISYSPSGTTEVRYFETNQIIPGAGYIVIGEEEGHLDFVNTDPDVVLPASLGHLKAIFK